MYHLGVVHIPMILMGIINKDYYLQLIRNKKTFQPLNPLTNRLLPSLSVLDFEVKNTVDGQRIGQKRFASKNISPEFG